jgi:hypothetical protein
VQDVGSGDARPDTTDIIAGKFLLERVKQFDVSTFPEFVGSTFL